ncbi:MAG: hypothetical protein CM1200mP2_16680 [Planctomycetaceae bacterium]|nr:MAG: hypothetical protein CM1200mP2_16680 [Planctomycetaceae bacterium]
MISRTRRRFAFSRIEKHSAEVSSNCRSSSAATAGARSRRDERNRLSRASEMADWTMRWEELATNSTCDASSGRSPSVRSKLARWTVPCCRAGWKPRCGIPDVMDVVDQVIDGINRFLRGPALLQERLQDRCHSRIRFRPRRGKRLDGRGNLRGLKITVGFVASQQCDQIGEFRVGHVRFASTRGRNPGPGFASGPDFALSLWLSPHRRNSTRDVTLPDKKFRGSARPATDRLASSKGWLWLCCRSVAVTSSELVRGRVA